MAKMENDEIDDHYAYSDELHAEDEEAKRRRLVREEREEPSNDSSWFAIATMEELTNDQTSNFVFADYKDYKPPSGEKVSEIALDQIERQRQLAKEAKEARLRSLTEEYEMLQEQTVLYMDIKTQLAPLWLADKFRKLEQDAKKDGFEDIQNKCADQARLIEMMGNRSASTSRNFSLYNPNEVMARNASAVLVFRDQRGE